MMGSFLRYEGRVSAPLQYRLLRCSWCIECLVAPSRRSKRPRRFSLEGLDSTSRGEIGCDGWFNRKEGLGGGAISGTETQQKEAAGGTHLWWSISRIGTVMRRDLVEKVDIATLRTWGKTQF